MTRRHAQCRRSQRHLPAGSYAPLPSAGEDGEQGVASGEGAQGAELKACLTTLDLVSLGVGSCLGTGVYLTTGLVASTMAGPAGVISLLVAGLVSILSGLCYAELAGLCPKTSGSAYMYAYITVGELAAFVIGWGLVVEYVIGTAAGGGPERDIGLSHQWPCVRSHGTACRKNWFVACSQSCLGRLDPVAAAICLLLTVLLASGVEMSARVNNLFNAINMLVLLFFVLASLVLGSFHNWVSVGFLPLGLTGVLHAIPTSYFAYIGFDTVATTGEEAKNPETSIPRSILLSVVINCLAYITVLACLTFALPYNLLHHDTALTDLFPQLKFPVGKYIIALGAVSGLFAAAFGSMFPLPRVLSAMAADGLIFRSLGKICPKRRTPLRATVLSGVVAMVMATFVKLDLLIELVLIGTLLAYVLVAFAVLLMRYARVDGQGSEWRDAVRGTDNPSLQTHSDAENDVDVEDEECKPSETEVDSATFRRHSAQHCEPTPDAPRDARVGRNRGKRSSL
ncbi:hypothetical protein C0Q70_02367 [Pomacea canaliculata]|uniref:Amino acid permease/ SLC12A domain-containing protein n=2 Tax=Pomacea canaliculata TaxID=400727 RepID=A0A2T7PPS0_POMCA|nr:hypothetical protein C0Q70_02367 [Pomacea canaliculata]